MMRMIGNTKFYNPSDWFRSVVARRAEQIKAVNPVVAQEMVLTERIPHQDIPQLRELTRTQVQEFIGTGDFASAFFDRRRYEVDAGRDMEMPLYDRIYDVRFDPNAGLTETIFIQGPANIAFEEVVEGEAAKQAKMLSRTRTLTQKHYSSTIMFSKDFFIFNRDMRYYSATERKAGQAYTALMNEIHLSPIINGSYAAANTTSASTEGTDIATKILNTIGDAITNSVTDTANPRYGPYVLLISRADMYRFERALMPVPQEGVSLQALSILNEISAVLPYDGWSGHNGERPVVYGGVPTGTAFLIATRNREQDLVSIVKQDLTMTPGLGDPVRFMLEQLIWDAYVGVSADVTRAVEKITLPTS